MPRQVINVSCEIGASDTLASFYATELSISYELPPKKASRLQVKGLPPDNEEIRDRLNSTDYRGRRMTVRINGQPMGRCTIYSIKQEEGGIYDIVGMNVTKNLMRNSLDSTYSGASSNQVIVDAVNEIGNPSDNDVGGAVTRNQPFIAGLNDDSSGTNPQPIDQTIENRSCESVIDDICNKNEWIWWINPVNDVCYGEASEAYRVGRDDSPEARRGLREYDLANVLEISPGLQQPAWSQVIVYGGVEQTAGVDEPGDPNQADDNVQEGDTIENANDARDNANRALSGTTTPEAEQQAAGDDEGSTQEDTSGQENDGSDTNSGPENTGSGSGSGEPVVGRAYIKSQPQGEGPEATSEAQQGQIVKGDPPGSQGGGDIDEDGDGTTTDESEGAEASNENPNNTSLAGPKPIYKWTDMSVKTQDQADSLAASILRSFRSKRNNGKITVVGRNDIIPMDIVNLPPNDSLQEPDLGGQRYLVEKVEHNLKEDGPYKTIIHIGGVIDGLIQGRTVEEVENQEQENEDGNGEGSDTTGAPEGGGGPDEDDTGGAPGDGAGTGGGGDVNLPGPG